MQGKLASDVAACSLGSNSLGITVVDCSAGERAGPKACPAVGGWLSSLAGGEVGGRGGEKFGEVVYEDNDE